MGLYSVPQNAGDAAMTAAVARFRLRAPKPEAFVMIADSTVALHLEEAYDRMGSALGDRATLPLLEVDASLDGAVMKLAALSLMRERGFSRQQGADSSIEAGGEEALAYLARCKPSGDANGKSENPRFTDSRNNIPLDAPSVTASRHADAFIDNRRTALR